MLATARATELRRALGQIARQASGTNAGASGSAVFGAVADGVEQVRALQSSSRSPAVIVVITDGDEAADGTHLRLLLESGANNTTIVNRIVGKLEPPDARGMNGPAGGDRSRRHRSAELDHRRPADGADLAAHLRPNTRRTLRCHH